MKSRTASLSLLFAAVAFVAAVSFFVIGAPEYVGYRDAFQALRVLAWVGILGTAVCVTFYFARRRSGVSPMATAIATLLFGAPVLLMIANEATPPPGDFINDITTDLDDPPVFSAVIPLRPAGSNPIEYGGPAVAARQREAYPDIAPIISSLTRDAAFQHAFETAESLGWEIVSGDLQAGIIEAIDTTRFFRFKDDVVIRIRENSGGTRIDLRSRSRVGRSDLGKNANRIRDFVQSFNH